MINSVGYDSYNSYLKSYYMGRNHSSGSVSAVSPISRAGSATVSAFLPFDALQQARITSAMRDVNSIFSQLKTAAYSLTPSITSSVYNKCAVDTTNAAVISATAQDKAKQVAYSVSVNQVAERQQNSGAVFNAAGNAAGFAAGENKFSLTVGSKATQLSFTVQSGDNNKTALTNMAGAINNAKVGASAKVVDTTANGVISSRLVLTADKTGTDNAFALRDEKGNAVAQSGASLLATEARNARYSVNGIEKTSQSNSISLDSGKVAVTLKAATSQPVTLTVKTDSEAIVKSVTEFVNTYNRAVGILQDNSGFVLRNLTRSANNNQTALANIGITVKADKTLAVDAAKLEKAAHDKPYLVERTISGSSGLASQTAKTVGAIIPDLSSTVFEPGAANTYQTQFNQYRYNNLNTMLRSMYGVGNLFDSYM